MKKFNATLGFTLSLFSLFFLSGCIKDEHDCTQVYKIYVPVYKSLTAVRAEMKSSAPQEINQTGKLYIYDHYVFLNEPYKGIHIIDNKNPSSPKNISFIPIPGNVDLAVKGDYLYADSYTDLVVFDISNPTNVTAKKFLDKVFQENWGYFWGGTNDPDSVQVLSDYVARDTIMSCATYSALEERMLDDRGALIFASTASFSSGKSNGAGGSMARFTIVNNYLYTVSRSELYSFNISAAVEPALEKKTALNNWSIETIFPFKNKLFIGSASGMYIYDLASPSSPTMLGQMNHVRSCDPVIADDRFAYVTLRSGTACAGFTNQLEVLNIENLTQPSLIKVYQMTNPHGLSKDSNLLFICDGKDGLKVYDATNVNSLSLIKTFSGLETYDVIAYDKLALVVASDGLYQYNYSDRNNIKLLSKISLHK